MTDDKKFEDPSLAINRVYTRKGDKGQTSLVGGQRVPKDSARLDAYGTVDELNAIVGMCRQTLLAEHGDNADFDELGRTLLRVQHELFNLGSILATLPEDVGEKMPRVGEEDVEALEASIDEMNEELPALRSFVLPGGSKLNAELHLARTVCRRAERR
ncbi:MAG: cob(I)yrinic acid a,c-diamide adenosyltransferase, partial [Persicimonas sp.]